MVARKAGWAALAGQAVESVVLEGASRAIRVGLEKQMEAVVGATAAAAAASAWVASAVG